MTAGKGKLREALERAKQRKATHPDGRYGWAAEALTADGEGRRRPVLHTLPPFARTHYDPARCAANRILVDDSPAPHNSGGAAAYRVLRTRVLHRVRSNQWTTLGVTSPGVGDGKSVTALNLALSIAREGNNNVFLLDLDMRNPKMCHYLGVTPPMDINRFFAGAATPEDVFFSIGIRNLTLAGTLTHTDQASELLASGLVEDLFRYVRHVAPEPLILLDLPPLLSTDDALVIAPKVDACLLVLSEGKSRRDSAAKALELLAEFNLAGIVLNRSSQMVQDYYSGY